MEFLTMKVGLASLLPLMIIFEWWVDPVAPIDEANFARIKNGMTKNEVEKILGPLPPGEEVQGDLFGKTLYTNQIWNGRGCAIVVSFADDRVNGKYFLQPPLWQRITDWMNELRRVPDGDISKRLNAPT